MTAANVTSLQTENADLVRRGYAAFNTADIDALMAIFSPNATWHTPGRGVLAGDAIGRDAVFARFGRYGGDTNGSFKAELRYVASDPEGRVVGVHHNSAERNGKRLDVDCCIVFEIKDGQVISGREHFFDLHAWDAFWS